MNEYLNHISSFQQCPLDLASCAWYFWSANRVCKEASPKTAAPARSLCQWTTEKQHTRERAGKGKKKTKPDLLPSVWIKMTPQGQHREASSILGGSEGVGKGGRSLSSPVSDGRKDFSSDVSAPTMTLWNFRLQIRCKRSPGYLGETPTTPGWSFARGSRERGWRPRVAAGTAVIWASGQWLVWVPPAERSACAYGDWVRVLWWGPF